MPTVLALDHVNIQTTDLAGTARFFAEVLDLAPGEAVPGAGTERVVWMRDAGGRPLVHLTLPGATFADDAARAARADTGALHHVAFECQGHADMLARLERLGLAWRTRDIPTIGLRQVFVTEPNGTLLELNFRGD